VYKSFLDILNMYRKENKSITEVYQEVCVSAYVVCSHAIFLFFISSGNGNFSFDSHFNKLCFFRLLLFSRTTLIFLTSLLIFFQTLLQLPLLIMLLLVILFFVIGAQCQQYGLCMKRSVSNSYAPNCC